MPVLEVPAMNAEESAEKFGALLNLPRSALEVVPITDGSRVFVVLKSPRHGADRLERLVLENAELRIQSDRAVEVIDQLLARIRSDAEQIRRLEDEIASLTAPSASSSSRKSVSRSTTPNPPRPQQQRTQQSPLVEFGVSGPPVIPPLELSGTGSQSQTQQLPGIIKTTPSPTFSRVRSLSTPYGLHVRMPSAASMLGMVDEPGKPLPTGPCRVSGCKCTGYQTNKETSWLCDCGHTSVKHQSTPKGSPLPSPPSS